MNKGINKRGTKRKREEFESDINEYEYDNLLPEPFGHIE
jgi:hypothetical protein